MKYFVGRIKEYGISSNELKDKELYPVPKNLVVEKELQIRDITQEEPLSRAKLDYMSTLAGAYLGMLKDEEFCKRVIKEKIRFI